MPTFVTVTPGDGVDAHLANGSRLVLVVRSSQERDADGAGQLLTVSGELAESRQVSDAVELPGGLTAVDVGGGG